MMRILSMKRVLFSTLLVSLLVATAVVGITPRAAAQESTMTHVCDSTLITLLYIAEHDYGFHSMMDVSTFEKGQFAPLFESMMAMMEGDMVATEEAMMEGDMMATEEAMMEGDMMATEEAMMEDMGDMVMLTPGSIDGEDPACTDLRAELDAFFYAAFTEGMMMESGS